MKNCYNGFKEKVLTFESDGVIAANTPVKLSDNGKVTAAAAGDRFIGFAVACEGDFVTVQVEGYRTAVYSGTAPTVNFSKLVADGTSKVKTDDTGSDVLVLDVNTTDKTVGFIL